MNKMKNINQNLRMAKRNSQLNKHIPGIEALIQMQQQQ